MNIFCQILWTQNRWNLLDIFNRFLNMNFSILEFLTVRLTVYLNLDLKKLVCIESVVKLFILKMLGFVFFCRKLRTYWPVSSSWVMGEHIHLGAKDLKFEKWGSLSLKILTRTSRDTLPLREVIKSGTLSCELVQECMFSR